MPNTTLGEEIACDGSTQDDLVHLLQQPHRTEIRKATERVVMTEVQQGRKPKFTGNGRSGKANRPPCINSKQGSCHEGNSCNCWGMSLSVLSAEHQLDASTETSSFTHTAKYADEMKNQQMSQSTMQLRKISRMTRPNSERDSIISRTRMFWKESKWDQDTESSRQDPRIREIQALQHSVKDPSNGPCAWKKWQGKQLGFHTRARTRFQIRILRIDMGSPIQVPRTTSNERIHCGLGSFTSFAEWK